MARKFQIVECVVRTAREGLLLYDEAVRAAGANRLATRAEMVAYMSSRNRNPLYDKGDHWVPVSDEHNEWVDVGSKHKDWIGKTYSDTHKGEKPDWGVTSGWGNLDFRGLVVISCCGAETSPIEQAKREAAKEAAGGAGGPSAPAYVGCDPRMRGKLGPPRKYDGSLTWNAALAEAKKLGTSLANQAEIQQWLAYHYEGKGARPGDVWVPVCDAKNEWVSIGDKYPDRVGKTHTQVAGSTPEWSNASGWKPWRGLVFFYPD